MSNIQPYIILNGTDSRSISGLLISSLPPISKPQVRTQIETVDGRDGDIVTPLGFSAYDKVINIGLTYNYDVDEIIEYFNSEGIVTFSNEPDKYYRYSIYEQIDFEKLIRFKTAEVTLHVQPFKFSTTEEPELFDVVSGQAIAVTNEGNTDSRPNLTIIGSGDIDVSLNGSQILSIELEDDQAVIIDSEDMNAYAAQSAIREVVVDIQAKQAGSGDPSPSNIREISGYNAAIVSRCGINLAKSDNTDNPQKTYYSYTTDTPDKVVGVKNHASNMFFYVFEAYVVSGNTYRFHYGKYQINGANSNCSIYLYSDRILGNAIGNFLVSDTGYSWVSNYTGKILIGIYGIGGNGSTFEIDEFMLSDTASEYQSYIGSRYQEYFKGLTNGSYNFVDLGSLTWQKNGVNRFTATQPTDDIKAPTQTTVASIICNRYQAASFGDAYAENNDKVIAINVNKHINIVDKSYTDATEFKNNLSGVYLIYEVETPTTPTITQSDLDTLISAFNADLSALTFNQTVYGGSLNVTTGELTVTHEYCVFNGTETITSNQQGGHTRFSCQKLVNLADENASNENFCSHFIPSTEPLGQNRIDNAICVYRRGIYWRADQFTDETAMKNYLLAQYNANTPIMYVAKLATPIELQLTPTQINNLLGVNNMYSDTGDITVKHKSNGVIVTDTGSIVSFSAGLDDIEKGVLLNRAITGDYDKIRLRKGVNTFVLTGNAQQFAIDKYSRWI